MNPKDQIKENLSITEVVSTYVRLEKSGAQFRARCPFHNERTPSFYVSPERKSFHCFGCGVHGDIFTFVEKIENIPFYESLKILADRAGVSLKDAQKNKEDSRLISLLADATKYFENNLQESAEAKMYLAERGISEESIKTFHVGYAKNEWRTLFIHLASLRYSPEEMEQAGVIIKALDEQGNLKGYYDRFRGRIMFPIRNISGATVGYSGRIMPALVDPTVAQGKYVNSPETLLYHKSKILFGYDTAKKEMYEKKFVVVVEGQMDLVMSYQAGVHNTVAVSGTAFTDEHIKLIKRFADKVILSFDSDSAGQTALKKSALLCLYGGLDVYVACELGTKDPADLIKENKEAWIKAIDKRVHVVEFMLANILKTETDMREQGKKVVTEVLPFVRAIQSSIDRAHFIKIISDKTGISQEALNDELSRGVSEIEEDQISENQKQKVTGKERVMRELAAFIVWKNLQEHHDVVKLDFDISIFPEAVLNQEMMELEKRTWGDTEKVLKDLIKVYKKEILKEEQEELKIRLRNEPDNEEEIQRMMHEVAKKLQELIRD